MYNYNLKKYSSIKLIQGGFNMNYKKWLTQSSVSNIVLVLTVVFIVFFVLVYFNNLENILKEDKDDLKIISNLEKLNAEIKTQHILTINNISDNKQKKFVNKFFEIKDNVLYELNQLSNQKNQNEENKVREIKENYIIYILKAEKYLKDSEQQNIKNYFEGPYQLYDQVIDDLQYLLKETSNELDNSQKTKVEILKEAEIVIFLISILSLILGLLYIKYIPILFKK